MSRPEGYDPSLFACSRINPLCSGGGELDGEMVMRGDAELRKLPNNKYMINWPLLGNDYYVNLIEMDPEGRDGSSQKSQTKNPLLPVVYKERARLS